MNFRKSLWINPSFQISFILYSLIVAAGVIAIIFVANVYFFEQFRHIGLTQGLPEGHLFFRLVERLQHQMIFILGLAFLAIAGFILTAGVLFSHHVAGSLHRLRLCLLKAAQGQSVEPIRIRKRDFFPEFAEATNLLLAKMAARNRKGSS